MAYLLSAGAAPADPWSAIMVILVVALIVVGSVWAASKIK